MTPFSKVVTQRCVGEYPFNLHTKKVRLVDTPVRKEKRKSSFQSLVKAFFKIYNESGADD